MSVDGDWVCGRGDEAVILGGPGLRYPVAFGSTPLSLEARIGHAARVRLAMTDTTATCGLERRELWTNHPISTAEANEGQVGA